MSHVYIGPTELFTAAWCDQDEHVKAWRWYWYTKGVTHLKPKACW